MAVEIEAVPDEDGNPWVGITMTGLSAGDHRVRVWRIADGERRAVERGRPVTDSDYLIDYSPPLNRSVTYSLEVVSGPDAGSVVEPVTVTVQSATGLISDPLDPTNVIPVHVGRLPNGEPTLVSGALARLDYRMDASLLPILGSSQPVALLGQRLAASGIDFSVFTDAAEQNTALHNLLMQAGPILVRPIPSWGDGLPGLCYTAIATVGRNRVDQHRGGVLTQWDLAGDLVAAPTNKILIALFTYDDVEALFATYDQKQLVMSGKTYLDDLKDPLGADASMSSMTSTS